MISFRSVFVLLFEWVCSFVALGNGLDLPDAEYPKLSERAPYPSVQESEPLPPLKKEDLAVKRRQADQEFWDVM